MLTKNKRDLLITGLLISFGLISGCSDQSIHKQSSQIKEISSKEEWNQNIKLNNVYVVTTPDKEKEEDEERSHYTPIYPYYSYGYMNPYYYNSNGYQSRYSYTPSFSNFKPSTLINKYVMNTSKTNSKTNPSKTNVKSMSSKSIGTKVSSSTLKSKIGSVRTSSGSKMSVRGIGAGAARSSAHAIS